MKKSIILFLCSISILFSSLSAGFNFSNKSSKIRINSNASFIVNKQISNVDGTLDIVDNEPDRITGNNTIFFQSGFLGNGLQSSSFSGTFNPSGNAGEDTIVLNGTEQNPNIVRSEQGTVLQKVEVAGQYNFIEGSPSFGDKVVFDGDTNTTLTVGIRSKLDNEIELNDGTIFLSNDLALADNASISGSGKVNLNSKSFHFPGKQSSWSSDITFENAEDIELHAKTILSGSWIFSGVGTINGNGVVLDISNGGRIVVTPGSQINLNDIVIKGVGNIGGLGGFELQDQNSKVVFSNVTVELESDYTTGVGQIYVDGPTTVISKDHQWVFYGTSLLTVDGVTLWTDRAGHPDDHGLGIQFAVPESSHYDSVSSGTIKKQCSVIDDLAVLQGEVNANSSAIATNSSDIAVLDSRVDALDFSADGIHLLPGETLTFATNQTVDGQGKSVIFSNCDSSQFIVGDGVTVTLKNIDLLRINSNTFSMGASSKIIIGENVTFELNQDLLWNYGMLEMSGTSDLFIIRGLGRTRKLNFGDSNCTGNLALALGSNSLLLQNIELDGLCFIDGTSRMRDRYLQVGSITLGGNAVVNVNHTTGMNFVAAGKNNQFCLRENNILFTGSLLFGDLFSNELHIKFLLDDEQMGSIPRVDFGEGFAFITSTAGLAKLIFDDSYVQIFNQNENSFVVSQYSYLQGFNLEILNNPIKQIHNDFTFSPGLVLTSDCLNPIEQVSIKSPFVFGRSGPAITTAFHLSGIKLGECFEDNIFKAWTTNNDLEIAFSSIQLSDAKNSVRLEGGTITKFGINSAEALKLTMVNGAAVEQGSSDIEFKAADELVVSGLNNKFIVTNKVTLKGKLTLQSCSDLTFEFVQKNGSNPEIYFESEVEDLLEIAAGAMLTFKGRGRVVFKDGYTIEFKGESCGNISEFRLQDSAELNLAENGTCFVKGEGKFSVDDKSKVYVDTNKKLIFGLSDQDSIELVIDREGQVLVNSLRDLNNPGKISFQLADYKINVKRGGKFLVGNGGVLEINSLDGQEQRGYLSHFIFDSDGLLQVDQYGKFLLGRNKGETELPFLLDCVEGSISTGGLIGLISNNLIGEMQDISSVCCGAGQIEIDTGTFVLVCINQMPNLLVTVMFVDDQGKQKIRTKDGVIVELWSGDTILEDNATTGEVSILNDGEIFTISASGQRT